jgi:hypothetical protein
MLKRFCFCFMLGCGVILAASCANKNEPKEDPPGNETPVVKEAPAPKETPPAKPDPREVTFHVDGMSERLKLI